MTDNIYEEIPQVGATFADSINESPDYRENSFGGCFAIKDQEDTVTPPADFDLDKLPTSEPYTVGVSTLTPDYLSPQEGVSSVPPYPPFRGPDWPSKGRPALAPFLGQESQPVFADTITYNFGPVAEEALGCLKGIATLLETITEALSRVSAIFEEKPKAVVEWGDEKAEEESPKPRVRTKKGAPGRPKRRQPKTKVPQRNKRKTTVLKNTKPKKNAVKVKAKVKPKRR